LPQRAWVLCRRADASRITREFLAMTDGRTIGASASPFALTDTNWHFVDAGWDGSNIKISVDGGAFVTSPYSGPVFGDGTGAFQIGSEAASNTWNGLIDEVGIWIGRALSQTEVGQLYNNGAGLPFSSFH